eukprot:3791884-Pyramimonas_sp.AAC.1
MPGKVGQRFRQVGAQVDLQELVLPKRLQADGARSVGHVDNRVVAGRCIDDASTMLVRVGQVPKSCRSVFESRPARDTLVRHGQGSNKPTIPVLAPIRLPLVYQQCPTSPEPPVARTTVSIQEQALMIPIRCLTPLHLVWASWRWWGQQPFRTHDGEIHQSEYPPRLTIPEHVEGVRTDSIPQIPPHFQASEALQVLHE